MNIGFQPKLSFKSQNQEIVRIERTIDTLAAFQKLKPGMLVEANQRMAEGQRVTKGILSEVRVIELPQECAMGSCMVNDGRSNNMSVTMFKGGVKVPVYEQDYITRIIK